ncbi:MAG: hypothetical protein E2600_13800 [Chryseobacterium sp.]|nr:hypothetical protein [Chryseobacterium sp.]
MTLLDITDLGTDLKQSFLENTSWPELTFNEEDRKQLLRLPKVTMVDSHSIQLSVSTGNVIYVPSQYISMAIKIKPFAFELKKYVNIIEELKTSNSTENVVKFITDGTPLPVNEVLEHKDFEIFRKMFSRSDNKYRFNAKSIINGEEGSYIIRGDFFSSVILKIINMPDNSSSVLGAIIESLTVRPEIYEYLESRFSKVVDANIDNEVIVTFSDVLRVIIFTSFTYCLEKFGEDKVLQGFSTKQGVIADKKFIGVMLTKYFGNDNLLSIFKSEQDKGTLTSSETQRFFEERVKAFNANDFVYFTSQWTNKSKNGRKLSLVNFNKFLSEISSNTLRIIEDGEIYKLLEVKQAQKRKFYNKNVIFFGAPGTGKSHEVKEILKDVSPENFQRIIFHPEYDYTSFVGGYKPVTVFNDEKKEHEVQYNFQPEVFINMYVKAWQNEQKHFYLAIEEINRGNCAEIFGDIFQLLDRNPEYSITPSANLQRHLEKTLGNDHEGFKNGKMTMPENLTILATMNTSDQSLFPMDSAFKRRWEWIYIPILNPINPDDVSSDSFKFVVMLNDNEGFRWIDFMTEVNKHIEVPYIGMDKCLGNYFIKPDKEDTIEIKSFIHKVIFYLWNDVFKDEENEIFENKTTYHSFFPVETNGSSKIRNILKLLNVTVNDYSSGIASEQTEEVKEQNTEEE